MGTAQVPTYQKVVTCPILTQSALKAIGSQFLIANADWNMCSHIIITEDQKGNEIFYSGRFIPRGLCRYFKDTKFDGIDFYWGEMYET